ncbi:MAG: hypothetical protein FWH20_04185 [Oscillospiraceae bacterium]|nr:hypothetical protein [Oscillospiraceae bacterium]
MKTKTLISTLLTLTLLLALAPVMPLTAQAATFNISTAQWSSGTSVSNNCLRVDDRLILQDGANVTVTGAVSNGRRIEVAENATAYITLRNLSVSGLAADQSPLLLNSGAKLTVTLEGENTLTAGAGGAGIQAPSGTTLIIQGEGSLAASALSSLSTSERGAGIGGGRGEIGGNITINSGTITAQGGYQGAGIGGGGPNSGALVGGAGGSVTINGGTVTARGSAGGAGIGGGYGGAGGSVAISGGTVTAAGSGGAGIGGGYNGNGGSVTINGGTVTATGGSGGAGIGGGYDGNGGNITITGGKVNAEGGSGAAGIGGGVDGNGAEVLIAGGTVTATNAGTSGGSGIGNGGIGYASGAFALDGGVVFASSVRPTGDDLALNNGILFMGNTGAFHGENVALTDNVTIPENHTLTVPTGAVLTIPLGVTLHNDGTVYNNGRVIYFGDWTGNAVVLPTATIDLSDPTPPESGTGWTYADNIYTISGANVTVTGTSTNQRRIEIAENATASITLNNVQITGLDRLQSPILLNDNANLTVTLVGNNTLTAGGTNAGIRFQDVATLIIQGEGSLVTGSATTGGGGLGGSGKGSITINSGIITATGGLGADGGAGISGGNITINGGTVTAEGGNNSMAIYGGDSVTINGGSVTAIAGSDTASAITTAYGTVTVTGTYDYWTSETNTDPGGPGTRGTFTWNADYSYIKLQAVELSTVIDLADTNPPESGEGWRYDETTDVFTILDNANVTATGENRDGRRIEVAENATATLTIKDLSITWHGLDDYQSSLSLGDGAALTLILIGDNVLEAGWYAAGIRAPAGTTLIIKGDGSLIAHGGNGGAGIGGGSNSGVAGESGGNITIESGTITATGLGGAAGIGGGVSSVTGGTITINGGTVTANGGTSAAGIGGGGLAGNGGTITINGGTVTATGGDFAAGIGGGYYCNSGNITITGGNVTAIAGDNASAIGAGVDGTNDTITITGEYTYWTNTTTNPPPVTPGTRGEFTWSDTYRYIKLQELEKFVVTFDTDGGNPIPDIVFYGDPQPIQKPHDDDATLYNATLIGWFTAEDTEWDFNDPVTASMTLYAKWERHVLYVNDVEVQDPTVPNIKNAIDTALNNSDEVKVTGAFTGEFTGVNNGGLVVSIPENKTLVWDAKYLVRTYDDLISLSGAGTMRIDPNAVLRPRTANLPAIVTYETVKLVLDGGSIVAMNSAIKLYGDSALAVLDGSVQGSIDVLNNSAVYIAGGDVDNYSIINYDDYNTRGYYIGDNAAKFNSFFTPGVDLFKLDAAPEFIIESGFDFVPYTYDKDTAHNGRVYADFSDKLTITEVTAITLPETAWPIRFGFNTITFAGLFNVADITLEVAGTVAGGRIPVAFTTAPFGINIDTPAIFVNDPERTEPLESTSEIASAIMVALRDSDEVVVTGKFTGADTLLMFGIPENKTLTWDAEYLGNFYIFGAGSMILSNNAVLQSDDNIYSAISIVETVKLVIDGGTVSSAGGSAILSGEDSALVILDGTVNVPISAGGDVVYVAGGTLEYPIRRSFNATGYFIGNNADKFHSSFTPGENLFKLDDTTLTTSDGLAYTYDPDTPYNSTLTATFPADFEITTLTVTPENVQYTQSGNTLTFAGTYHEDVTLEVVGTLANGRIPVEFTTAEFGVNINTQELFINGNKAPMNLVSLQTDIQRAFIANDTVTITGRRTDLDNGFYVEVPANKKLVWDAEYKGALGTTLLTITARGAGVEFELGENADINNTGSIIDFGGGDLRISSGRALAVAGSTSGDTTYGIKFTMNGGKITAVNENALVLVNATAVILDGEITNAGQPDAPPQNARYTVLLEDSSLEIHGGKFTNTLSTVDVIDVNNSVVCFSNAEIIDGGINRTGNGFGYYMGDANSKFRDTFNSTNLFKLNSITLTTADGAYVHNEDTPYGGKVTATFATGLEITSITASPTTAQPTFETGGNTAEFAGTFNVADIKLLVEGTLADGRIPVTFGTEEFGVNVDCCLLCFKATSECPCNGNHTPNLTNNCTDCATCEVSYFARSCTRDDPCERHAAVPPTGLADVRGFAVVAVALVVTSAGLWVYARRRKES